MELLREMLDAEHEQVVFVGDRETGLRAIIAIHSTALGPALGGVRFWRYPAEVDAIRDALLLSEAMSLKASAAGLDQGGGKAVVLLDPEHPRDEAQVRALGRAIDELGGRYIAAEDVGASPRDMDWLAKETPWATGVDMALGGSGDPSPMTAVGVLAGMRAACTEAFGSRDLGGRRVAVTGVGHVGSHLVRLLVAEGAQVTVADLDAQAVARLVESHDVASVPADAVHRLDCDVLAPCALGGLLDATRIPELRCRVICGAANNQLADLAAGDALQARGIVYAPDFVVNAGGIINIAEEFVGYDPARAEARTRLIEETAARVFELARERGVSPARAADAFARERIARVGKRRRYAPHGRTAWSQGAPLLRLRAP